MSTDTKAKGAPAQPKAHAGNTPLAEQPAGSTAMAEFDYGEDSGASFKTLGAESMMIPFITVLQGQSPQIESLEGAKPGMLVNSVTNELFTPTEGLAFVPSDARRVFMQWRPRKQGGGIVGRHEPNSEFVQRITGGKAVFGRIEVDKDGQVVANPGKEALPGSTEVIETYYMYGIAVGKDGSFGPACVSFSSTGIKAFRNWRTQIALIQLPTPNGGRINPPAFAHRFRITSQKEKNSEGEWWAMVVKFDGADAAAARLGKTNPLYMAARDLARSVNDGTVTLAAEPEPVNAGPTTGGAAPTDKF